MSDSEIATAVANLYFQHRELIAKSPASAHNHQTWPGGYLCHLEQMNEMLNLLWDEFSQRHKYPFTREDAAVCILLHDIHKPWKYAGLEMPDISHIEVLLTPMQREALKYIHGEGSDYSGERRVMNELAAFVHICDVYSARITHSLRSDAED